MSRTTATQRNTLQQTATCRGCGARIIWMPTAKGKAMPVDAKPNPDGNMILRNGALLFGATAEHLRDGEQLRMPHWATCPQSGKFKR